MRENDLKRGRDQSGRVVTHSNPHAVLIWVFLMLSGVLFNTRIVDVYDIPVYVNIYFE